MARKNEFSAADLALAVIGGAIVGAIGMALVDKSAKPAGYVQAGQISPAG